ncbi:hypothetical protein, partial [Nostoc sp.]|uniref:hypothetical protein n=1 Tax=Nostoc sp. TaxID=1180 RepID=UPI002FFB2D72
RSTLARDNNHNLSVQHRVGLLSLERKLHIAFYYEAISLVSFLTTAPNFKISSYTTLQSL